MKNPGLCAAASRGRANRRAEPSHKPCGRARVGRRGRITATDPGATGRSGRVHSSHDLLHRLGVLCWLHGTSALISAKICWAARSDHNIISRQSSTDAGGSTK
jgi:hypothetical protein